MRFKHLGTSLGNTLYGCTIDRHSFLVTKNGNGFSATYKDLHGKENHISHFIGDGYSTINDARLACEAKLKELTG